MNLRKKSKKSLKGKKINKYYWDKVFNHWFNIPYASKKIYFKNPNECNSFYFEKVNPNHIGIIWGKRDKKLSKNWIRIGKIFFSNIIMTIQYLYKNIQETIIYLFNNPDILLLTYYICFGLFFYAFIMRINPFDYLMILKRG